MPSFTLKNFQRLDRKSCRYIILLSHTLKKVHNNYKRKTAVAQTKQMKNLLPLTLSALIAGDCRIKANMENNSETEMSKWLNLFIQHSQKNKNWTNLGWQGFFFSPTIID